MEGIVSFSPSIVETEPANPAVSPALWKGCVTSVPGKWNWKMKDIVASGFFFKYEILVYKLNLNFII